MNWADHHSKSEEFASQAAAASKNGEFEEAVRWYKLAAEAEAHALSELDPLKKRTLGITAVSVAALYFKGKEFEKAEQVAHQWLASNKLPSFALEQLQEILQTIWNERVFDKAGVSFAEGTVLVSVRGGLIVPGGAPLDLIHRKVDEVKNIFYRVIEMLLHRPFRRRGSPETDIQEQFRPWLFQAAPSSYQFAVRVQKPSQMSLFPDDTPEINEVISKFFEVLTATAKDAPQELEKIVPNNEYRESFLKLTRNLAPTGKSFNKLQVRSATELESLPIEFVPESRKSINATLRKSKKKTEAEQKFKEVQLSGILRALHLDRDWIEIILPEEDNKPVRILQTGDIIDDIVGPMVNHRVIVDVLVKPDGKYIFRDIQSED